MKKKNVKDLLFYVGVVVFVYLLIVLCSVPLEGEKFQSKDGYTSFIQEFYGDIEVDTYKKYLGFYYKIGYTGISDRIRREDTLFNGLTGDTIITYFLAYRTNEEFCEAIIEAIEKDIYTWKNPPPPPKPRKTLEEELVELCKQ